MDEQETRIASLEASNSDLRGELRETRHEIRLALRFIENGDTGSAQSLLHRLSISATEK
ncbi:hypothetical protein [Streptomyces sp. NPDC047829]|uniref:hypothetical protein n=1 Tax=Streptomyces sp. NPDC047829 TaxID=3154609 RepID=UPI0033F0969A